MHILEKMSIKSETRFSVVIVAKLAYAITHLKKKSNWRIKNYKQDKDEKF